MNKSKSLEEIRTLRLRSRVIRYKSIRNMSREGSGSSHQDDGGRNDQHQRRGLGGQASDHLEVPLFRGRRGNTDTYFPHHNVEVKTWTSALDTYIKNNNVSDQDSKRTMYRFVDKEVGDAKTLLVQFTRDRYKDIPWDEIKRRIERMYPAKPHGGYSKQITELFDQLREEPDEKFQEVNNVKLIKEEMQQLFFEKTSINRSKTVTYEKAFEAIISNLAMAMRFSDYIFDAVKRVTGHEAGIEDTFDALTDLLYDVEEDKEIFAKTVQIKNERGYVPERYKSTEYRGATGSRSARPWGRGNGRQTFRGHDTKIQKNNPENDGKCFNCGKYGHRQKDCYSRKRDKETRYENKGNREKRDNGSNWEK